MNTTESLWKILRDEFGISTEKEFIEAYEKMPKLDVSIFCKDFRKKEKRRRKICGNNDPSFTGADV